MNHCFVPKCPHFFVKIVRDLGLQDRTFSHVCKSLLSSISQRRGTTKSWRGFVTKTKAWLVPGQGSFQLYSGVVPVVKMICTKSLTNQELPATGKKKDTKAKSIISKNKSQTTSKSNLKLLTAFTYNIDEKKIRSSIGF
jgi:hypothetical protein